MDREFKRQLIHLAFGLLLAAGAWLLPIQAYLVFLALVLLGQSLALLIPNPATRWVLAHVERPKNFQGFVGKGAMMMILGALLVTLLFPQEHLPAILVLAISDSLATLLGSRFGRSGPSLLPTKSWVGMVTFLVTAALILWPHTSWWPLVALVLTALEAVDYSDIVFLDDNLVIPLAAGALLFLL